MSRISGAAVATDGKLRIPQFGTEFSINFMSKSESNSISKSSLNLDLDLANIEKRALISVGPRPNLFYALFDEQDVDFSVLINNIGHSDIMEDGSPPNSRNRILSRNSECSRSVYVGLGIHNKCYGFVLPEKTKGIVETTETHGRKFHFVSQTSKEGKSLTSAAAAKYDVSYREASKLISRMNFHIEYSPESKISITVMNIITCEEEDKKILIQKSTKVKELKDNIGLLYQVDPNRFLLYFNGDILREERTLQSYNIQENSRVHFIFIELDSVSDSYLDWDSFPIYIQTLSGKRTTLYVRQSDTISKLKEKIEDKMGYRKDMQKILFGGKQLEDWRTLASFGIQDRTILFLCTKLVGGHAFPSQNRPHHFSSISQQVIRRILLESDSESGTNSSDSDGLSFNSQRGSSKKSPFEIGERGAICLGGISRQAFAPTTFTADSSIQIQNFTIEMRKSPKYGLL